MDFQSMREKLISIIVYMEKQKVGRAQCNYIHVNTPEYYSLFEQLYQMDTELFMNAVCDLRDLSDMSCSNMDVDSYVEVYNISMHALRLSAYFQIKTIEIPTLLKKLFVYSFELRKSTKAFEFRNGLWLYLACVNFLEGLSENSSTDKKQLYYHAIIPHPLVFTDFVTLAEVKDIYSALLYDLCACLGYVSSSPKYIKQAIKAATLYENLVSVDGWQLYFCRRSLTKLQKDILFLKEVGYERIPLLMKEIVTILEFNEFNSKKEKMRFYNMTIKKFSNQIEICLVNENLKIIDRFLCNYIAKENKV